MIKNELEKDFQYFIKNIKILEKKYKDKYIAIKNCSVLGIYDSYEDALEKTLKKHEVGTFLIQKVNANPNTYTLFLNRISVIV